MSASRSCSGLVGASRCLTTQGAAELESVCGQLWPLISSEKPFGFRLLVVSGLNLQAGNGLRRTL